MIPAHYATLRPGVNAKMLQCGRSPGGPCLRNAVNSADATPAHLSFIQGSGHGGSHPHLANEFLRALLEDRDPWPNATQSANWTCTGICAHQSAMRGGDIVRLHPMTKSGLSPAAGPCRGKNFQNRLSGAESRDLSIQLRRCGLRRSVQSWDPCVRFRHRSVSSCKSDPDSLLRVVPLLATFQDDLRVYK
jgi:hypothetical protein